MARANGSTSGAGGSVTARLKSLRVSSSIPDMPALTGDCTGFLREALILQRYNDQPGRGEGQRCAIRQGSRRLRPPRSGCACVFGLKGDDGPVSAALHEESRKGVAVTVRSL